MSVFYSSAWSGLGGKGRTKDRELAGEALKEEPIKRKGSEVKEKKKRTTGRIGGNNGRLRGSRGT